MHTCQHIFRHCIQDMMLARGATVVLATHQTELFPHASTLAVMGGGRILYSGGYAPPSSTHQPTNPILLLCLNNLCHAHC